MQQKITAATFVSWLLGIIVFIIGVLNLVMVHPVPGIVALFLSFVFFPVTNELLRIFFGFTIPLTVKIILGTIIIWFTLGVSDLGDILDSYAGSF